MKKVIGLVLVMIMVLSVTACSGGNQSDDSGASSDATESSSPIKSDSSSSTDSSSTDTAADPWANFDPMTPYGAYPETIVVTAGRITGANSNFPAGDNVESNALTRWLNEELNMQYKVLWEVEQSEFTNKLSLNIAAGDVPDMIPLNFAEYLLFRSLVNNGLAADLWESYEKCANDYFKEIIESYDYECFAPFNIDGKQYAIAGGQYAYEHNLLWVRQDWMDACGLEMPKTIEDIEHVLVTFQEKQPGGNAPLGLPMDAADPVGGYNHNITCGPILYATGGSPKTWTRDENGEVIYGSLLPGMKDGLAILADWYSRGLVDKQFVTRTAPGAGAESLVVGGEVGIWFAPWWLGYTITEFPAVNPGVEINCASAPLTTDGKGKFRHSWPAPAGDMVIMNANYPHPEVAIKIINLSFDITRQLDQELYDRVLKETRESTTGWHSIYPAGGFNLVGLHAIAKGGLDTRNYILNNGQLPEDFNPVTDNTNMWESAKSWIETHELEGMNWVDYVCRYLGAWETYNDISFSEPVKPVFSYATDSMANLKANLDKLELEMYVSIIMGEKPVDYFDEFVLQWKAQGGDTITAEVKALVDQN